MSLEIAAALELAPREAIPPRAIDIRRAPEFTVLELLVAVRCAELVPIVLGRGPGFGRAAALGRGPLCVLGTGGTVLCLDTALCREGVPVRAPIL